MQRFWDSVLERALRAGVSVGAFWGLTPHETLLVVGAARWHDEQALSVAWYTAALMRTKRMPKLKRFLGHDGARVLKGQELERRTTEFEELSRRMGTVKHDDK